MWLYVNSFLCVCVCVCGYLSVRDNVMECAVGRVHATSNLAKYGHLVDGFKGDRNM
jgi:hypothetical protein